MYGTICPRLATDQRPQEEGLLTTDAWSRRRKIETAILETVLYSDLFDYPLTTREITHYLIGAKADEKHVRFYLDAPRYINGNLQQHDGYVLTRKRDSLIARRRSRQSSSAQLWIYARRFVRVLAAMPFVRMVALTGALAMDNSARGDDIDVLIVTSHGRAWTARLFSVLLVVIGKLFGSVLCPNYVMTEDALELDQRNLFIAHEFAQMVPMYGLNSYKRMRDENPWVYEFLPNAFTPLRDEPEIRSGLLGRTFKRIGEWLLGGRWGDRLENWEMRRKQRKFAPEVTEQSNALLDRDHVKGHFVDYGQEIMKLYEARLARYTTRGAERV